MSTSTATKRHSLPGPKPLQLVDGNIPATYPSPTLSGLSTPPPSAQKSFNPRRQSSISYFPSDHTPHWDIRSPTVAAGSLKRSASLRTRADESRTPIRGDRRSTGSLESPSPVVDRGPLTLTEKHADLLRFIAQKESKCLELRTQLAMHEAELLQLKRKWERIVSRGMDRAYSSVGYGSTPSNAVMLNGRKGGAQGVGRLLELGEVTSPAPVAPPPSASAAHISLPPKVSANLRHEPTQSTSSVSTSGTASTHASSSSGSGARVRLSQSSVSSVDDEVYSAGARSAEVELSPASALRAAKLYRRKSRDRPVPGVVASHDSLSLEDRDDTITSWDARQRTEADDRSAKRASLQGALPPISSAPGMSPLAIQPVSSWMGSMGSSVGRKLEQLQKGDTFTKSQKRASLLLSDVSQSFFAALASPSAGSSYPSSVSPSAVSVSSNPFAASLSPLSTSPSSLSPAAPASLLEDDDGGAALGSVLVPDARPPPRTPATTQPTQISMSISRARVSAPAQAQVLDDDDDWNW
ncbi:hypothetical protein CERSUDRAFT_117057 [Gelatoporia subvermispora B]|uniref:Uncharacterized protein n=1 Tax=Ceriporiopsis subvermispora (strain B) TaxID=914234 RepID=M2PFX5_CERS8|nr:hypothetical protein CERSUDRAFT_117057 [Gelatoporia subvermispora B]